MNKGSIVIECECHTHLLMVNVDEDDNTVYLMFFEYTGPKSWWAKLRYKWRAIKRIIQTGKPYDDQLCLSPDEALQLTTFLVDSLKSNK